MRYQYNQMQQQQMQANSRALIKADNKLFRVQNPIRNELTTAILFLFKFHLKNSIKKTAEKHPQTNIIFDKVGGSWWKPEFHIVVGGKTKKIVDAATETLQLNLNRGKKKDEKASNKTAKDEKKTTSNNKK